MLLHNPVFEFLKGNRAIPFFDHSNKEMNTRFSSENRPGKISWYSLQVSSSYSLSLKTLNPSWCSGERFTNAVCIIVRTERLATPLKETRKLSRLYIDVFYISWQRFISQYQKVTYTCCDSTNHKYRGWKNIFKFKTYQNPFEAQNGSGAFVRIDLNAPKTKQPVSA